mgnify:CR=1 FL=1
MFDVMTAKFEEAGFVSDAKAYKDALEYRESLGPTYMGNFVAIPHGKCKEVLKPGIGFCRCKKPFIYESSGNLVKLNTSLYWQYLKIKRMITI